MEPDGYPERLDMPRLLGYTPMTVVAEKLHTIVVLDDINNRMKDFYNLWLLAGSHEFDGASEAGQPRFRSCLGKSGIFIDPGLLLGFRRYGLEPYPIQIAVGERVRLEIRDGTGIGRQKNE